MFRALLPIATVLVLVGSVVACAGPAPSLIGTATASPDTVSTPSPSVSASSAGTTDPSSLPTGATSGSDAWSRVEIPNRAASFTGIAVLPDRLVIVGNGGDFGMLPLAWTSTDGTTWATERPGGNAAFPRSANAWGDRVLAVGSSQTDRCPHPATLVTWLRGADGTWTQGPPDKDLCAGSAATTGIAPDHALLVGSGTADVPFILRSVDGTRWTAVAIGPDAGAPRVAVSFGGRDLILGQTATEVWASHSADGLVWSPLTTIARIPDAEILGSAPVGDRLVVIVRDGRGSVGILTTGDGVSWTSAAAEGLDGAPLTGIVPVDGGIVALGGDDIGPRAWASTDAESWQPVALPDGLGTAATLTGAAVSLDRAWLVGQVELSDRAAGAAWVGPLSLFGL